MPMAAGPACAQFAGKVSVQSDYLYRGYTLSARRPVGILDLSYDDPSGVYANASIVGAFSNRDNPGLLGLIGQVGYARRVAPEVSLDVGLTRLDFRQLAGSPRQRAYTEVYVGGFTRAVSAHVYYSPDYYYSGASTVYGELEAGREVWAHVRLNAHVGVLDYLTLPADLPVHATHYDWRVGASRRFGPVDLSASLSGGRPGYDYYDRRAHSETALVVGAGWTF